MRREIPAVGRRKSRAILRRSGFTIVEVALAAAIMAMGIATSITVLQRGFLMLDAARNITTSGQIMISQMEQIRMLDWATVSAYPSTDTTVTIDAVFTGNSAVQNRFTLTRKVVPLASNANVLEVTFSLSWRGIDGRLNTRTMSSYYARFGMHDFIYNGST